MNEARRKWARKEEISRKKLSTPHHRLMIWVNAAWHTASRMDTIVSLWDETITELSDIEVSRKENYLECLCATRYFLPLFAVFFLLSFFLHHFRLPSSSFQSEMLQLELSRSYLCQQSRRNTEVAKFHYHLPPHLLRMTCQAVYDFILVAIGITSLMKF